MQFYANECNKGRDANPNQCNSTLTSGTNNIYPYPYIDINDRGHRLRITHTLRRLDFHQDSTLDPLVGLQHPHTASCIMQYPLARQNTTQNSPLIALRPQNSSCANLKLAKCVWAIHQTRALFQVSPV